jgi:glutamate carboxypeptidase
MPSLLLPAADLHLEALLTDLRTLVNIDSGTYTPAGVARVADWLRLRFDELGFDTDIRPGDKMGPQLIARKTGPGRARVLLIGHMDTVFPDGEAERRPFRIENGRAYGPGVFDMKSGLLVALHALSVLAEMGANPFASCTMLCNSDEEVGSPESAPLVRELAQGIDAAIVLEPANRVDEVKVARKGVGIYSLTVRGRSSHAGVEPAEGRSAIVELAHRILALQALNGTIPGATLNVGVVGGGERPNVVADHALARIDVRAATAETARQLDAALRDLAAAPSTVPDTNVKLEGGFVHQPFEQSPASARLFALAHTVAADLGITLRGASTGGGSDGNTTAAMGIPTIDGMGPSGGLAHNPGEWISIESIAPRIALLTGLLLRLDAA